MDVLSATAPEFAAGPSISPMLNSRLPRPRAAAMAYREGERVKAMSNPDIRRPIVNSAQRFARLAERF
jgi:hypothetical protein